MFQQNKSLRAWIALLVLIIALALPSYALAGGWVVVTLDALPGQVIAGQPYALGMMARQHGIRPWQVDAMQIEAWQTETGQKLSFTAIPDQKPGHYQVELTFPQPGKWEWGIQSGLFPTLQPMPALLVENGSLSSINASRETASGNTLTSLTLARLLGGTALIAFAAGTILIVRSQKKRLPFLAGVVLLVLCGGLAVASYSSAEAETKVVSSIPITSTNESTGQQLFLAKGCVVCHINDRAIKGSEQYSVSMGPNLSAYRNDPDFLHTFLKDPRSAKNTSEMPNLSLKREEIDALVEFINNDED